MKTLLNNMLQRPLKLSGYSNVEKQWRALTISTKPCTGETGYANMSHRVCCSPLICWYIRWHTVAYGLA